MSILHETHARKRADGLGDALRAEIRAVALDVSMSQPEQRLARLAAFGITRRQIGTLRKKGVEFAKVGKYWLVDVATFRAMLDRQADVTVPDIVVPRADPLAGVDPTVRASFERVARGAPKATGVASDKPTRSARHAGSKEAL
jgi:hypothetical protein